MRPHSLYQAFPVVRNDMSPPSGSQTSVTSMSTPAKPRGAMPRILTGRPSMVTTRPITFGSPPSSRCQSAHDTIADVAGTPNRESSGPKSVPAKRCTPSTEKYDGVTHALMTERLALVRDANGTCRRKKMVDGNAPPLLIVESMILASGNENRT